MTVDDSYWVILKEWGKTLWRSKAITAFGDSPVANEVYIFISPDMEFWFFFSKGSLLQTVPQHIGQSSDE